MKGEGTKESEENTLREKMAYQKATISIPEKVQILLSMRQDANNAVSNNELIIPNEQISQVTIQSQVKFLN